MITTEEVHDIAAEQVHQRLSQEAGVDSTLGHVRAWTHEQRVSATQWMNALLRRKEGSPHEGDRYEWPEHVKAMQDWATPNTAQ